MSLSPDTREFLAAVKEAIELPAPATFGDRAEYLRLLEDRALDAVIALTGALGEPESADWGLGWHTDYLRRRLAGKSPIGYRHYDPDGGHGDDVR
ncbi:hypothetical protein OHA38_14240 [Streptomyces sp. NBC_01732]|uniref:hypothetical protein n=1 Tax=unclassified Streptomyces TaxID=2593676 RepID=UPI00352D3EF8|nr:hypothetical protein OHA38_14240 [Streptomyces sp. NBC_01732]